MTFTDTLTTWHEDGTVQAPKPPEPTRGIAFLPSAPAVWTPPAIPPMPANPVREFADHMDMVRQHMKDWVRKELHLITHGMSHEDRVKENP